MRRRPLYAQRRPEEMDRRRPLYAQRRPEEMDRRRRPPRLQRQRGRLPQRQPLHICARRRRGTLGTRLLRGFGRRRAKRESTDFYGRRLPGQRPRAGISRRPRRIAGSRRQRRLDRGRQLFAARGRNEPAHRIHGGRRNGRHERQPHRRLGWQLRSAVEIHRCEQYGGSRRRPGRRLCAHGQRRFHHGRHLPYGRRRRGCVLGNGNARTQPSHDPGSRERPLQHGLRRQHRERQRFRERDRHRKGLKPLRAGRPLRRLGGFGRAVDACRQSSFHHRFLDRLVVARRRHESERRRRRQPSRHQELDAQEFLGRQHLRLRRPPPRLWRSRRKDRRKLHPP